MSNWGTQRKPDPKRDQRTASLVAASHLRFRRLRQDAEAFAITQAVGRARHVPLRRLLGKARGDAAAAAARQLAMYLVHILLGRQQDVVGRLFGRDGSTVSHACRVIEDLRDNPPLETEIAAIERRLRKIEGQRDAA